MQAVRQQSESFFMTNICCYGFLDFSRNNSRAWTTQITQAMASSQDVEARNQHARTRSQSES